MIRTHPMKQSTLVLLVVVAILITMLVPKFLSGHGEVREEQFTTNDGQVLNCIVYTEASGSGGLDCFLEGEEIGTLQD